MPLYASGNLAPNFVKIGLEAQREKGVAYLKDAVKDKTVFKHEELRPIIKRVLEDEGNNIVAVFTDDYSVGQHSEYYLNEDGQERSSHTQMDEDRHWSVVTGFKTK